MKMYIVSKHRLAEVEELDNVYKGEGTDDHFYWYPEGQEDFKDPRHFFPDECFSTSEEAWAQAKTILRQGIREISESIGKASCRLEHLLDKQVELDRNECGQMMQSATSS